MANWEIQLVTKVLDTGELKTAIKERITSDTLHTQDARAIWAYIHEAYKTKGKVPTREMVRDIFPRIHLPEKVTDELVLLCDHVRKGHLSTELKRWSVEVSEMAESDPEAAAAHLSQANSRVSQHALIGEDIHLADSSEEVKREYLLTKRLKSSGKSLGIDYPWAPFNKESMGMRPGEFILLYGRPKNMKTFILCYMAAHAYFIQHRRVLFLTMEMSPKQIIGRVLCCGAKVDYGEYKQGELNEEKEQQIFGMMASLHEHEKSSVTTHGRRREATFVVASNSSTEGGGISSLQALIEQYEPDLVCVDGIYLLKDDRTNQRSRDWKNVANITSDLKQTAQRYKIPLIGTSQANRLADDKKKGGDLRDVSFSDAGGQDADLIVRTDFGSDENGNDHVNLIVAGSREFALHGIRIHGYPCTNFEFSGILKGKTSEKDQAKEALATGHEFAAKEKLERGVELRKFNSRPMLPENRLARAQKRRDYAVVDEDEPAVEEFRSRAIPNEGVTSERSRDS
jgi:replicative DNA helicase